jgi:hypothetical protein
MSLLIVIRLNPANRFFWRLCEVEPNTPAQILAEFEASSHLLCRPERFDQPFIGITACIGRCAVTTGVI